MRFIPTFMGGLLICAFGLVSCDQSRPREGQELAIPNTPLGEDLIEAQSPFDQRMADIMTHADRVEACRITEKRVKGQPGVKYVLGKANVVESGVAAELSTLLRDKRSYESAFIGCFQPGVQFDFIAKSGHVLVRVCFHCGNLDVTAANADGEEWRSGGTFIPAFAKLARLAKKIFPDDADIQTLNDSEEASPPK